MKINKQKIRDFIKNLIDRVIYHDISTMASSLSYYYLAAAIPMLFVLTNLLAKYMQGNDELLLEILSVLPESTQDIIKPVIDSLINSSNVTTISTVTLIFALWSASKGVQRLLISINKAYGINENRGPILEKIIGFLYTFLLIFLIIFLMILRLYSSKVMNLIDDFLKALNIGISLENFQWVIDLINGVFPVFIVIIALTFLYKQAPNRSSDYNISFKEALIGGIFSTIAMFIFSFAYSFFLENLSNMSVIYGTLAGVIALFLWIFLFSSVLILGAEIIASYKEMKQIKVTIVNPDDLAEKL